MAEANEYIFKIGLNLSGLDAELNAVQKKVEDLVNSELSRLERITRDGTITEAVMPQDLVLWIAEDGNELPSGIYHQGKLCAVPLGREALNKAAKAGEVKVNIAETIMKELWAICCTDVAARPTSS